MRSIPNTLITLLFFVGIIFLQIHWSKKDSKFLGLILPCISFFYSLLMLYGFAVYDNMSGTTVPQAWLCRNWCSATRLSNERRALRGYYIILSYVIILSYQCVFNKTYWGLNPANRQAYLYHLM